MQAGVRKESGRIWIPKVAQPRHLQACRTLPRRSGSCPKSTKSSDLSSGSCQLRSAPLKTHPGHPPKGLISPHLPIKSHQVLLIDINVLRNFGKRGNCFGMFRLISYWTQESWMISQSQFCCDLRSPPRRCYRGLGRQGSRNFGLSRTNWAWVDISSLWIELDGS